MESIYLFFFLRFSNHRIRFTDASAGGVFSSRVVAPRIVALIKGRIIEGKCEFLRTKRAVYSKAKAEYKDGQVDLIPL